MATEIKRKILVVDNNKVILRLISHFLEKGGYDVCTAEDGLLALKVLESFHPDFIFIDLIMPKINGKELCRLIRKMPEFDKTYLIIISAIAFEEKIDFLALGASACIAKGPAKVMQKDITTVLAHLEKNETAPLAKKIYGSEQVFERDITKELLAAKKHHEITLNNITDGLLELTQDATIISANKASGNIFGVLAEDLISQSFPDFFSNKMKLFLSEIIAKQNTSPVELGEERPIKLSEKYILLKLVSLYDNGQKFILVFMQDITKRKEVEIELKEHKEQLEEKVARRTAEYEKANTKLLSALSKVKQLSGLLPICASCKKIRDDKGYWSQIESYIRKRSEADFSHGICPECAKRFYPNFVYPSRI